MKLNRRLMLLTAIFSTLSYVAQAQYLTAQDIYKYAKSRNYRALSQIARYIDIQDGSGNTALCLAVIDDDYQTYNLLRQYGSNPQPYCLQSAIAASGSGGTFLGMGTTGWLVTGAIVAGGVGIAAAAGGGGGGGSSSSSSSSSGNNSGGNSDTEDTSATKYLDNEAITDADNGAEIVGKTVSVQSFNSNEDYLKAANNGTIKKIVQSTSTVSGIASDSQFTANALSFGGTKTGNITVAQRGSGDVYGIKGPQNSHINVNTDDDGDEGDGDIYNAVIADPDNGVATGNVTGNITIRNTGAGTGNIYGLQSKADNVYIANALAESESNSTTAIGNILIENINSNKNVYGIYSNADAENAESDDNAKAYGNITINNSGNGDVYGIKAVKETYNAEATEDSEAIARIDINNKGNGNVYGIHNENSRYMSNARAGHDRGSYETDAAKATATINIENTGTGNAYGLKTLIDRYIDIYNTYSYYGSTATGKIRISNNGTGNSYGIVGSNAIYNALANSGSSSYFATAKGYVNLLNKSSGNIYGLYSNTDGNSIFNNNVSNGATQTSVIEMANVEDGLAIGIYSKDGTVENSGDIKIHNLADGVAVGIYADGTTTVTNSGNITINRESYKDDMATDTTSDDVTYKASSTTGGKAVGIYGASGSTITNTGTIKINGAEKAYGIYSEDDESSVTNTGTILIDGKYTENAIRLNGSQLFQNGVLKIGSDWDDGSENSGNNNYLDDNHDNIAVEYNVETESSYIGKLVKATSYTASDYNANNGNIIQNSSTKNLIIGIQTTNTSIDIHNALSGVGNHATGNIKLTNNGSGNVYGMLGTPSNSLSNAYAYMKGTASATIAINNTSQGNAYGIYAGYAYNATNWSENTEGTVSGHISIYNSGSGNAYGMAGTITSNTPCSDSSWNELAQTTASIRIFNTGNGIAYGMQADSSASNGRRDEEKCDSVIEMINTRNGTVIGMGGEQVFNYGDIKIHNLGNGRAIGILVANGSYPSAYNYGTITIDREAYTDENSFDGNSHTYDANGDSGVAYGIYVANNDNSNKDYSVWNYGTIEIKNISSAYGIWVENSGEYSSVHNYGNIIINGNHDSSNAIRLNGGRLLQNGVLTASAAIYPQSIGNTDVQNAASLNLNDFGGTVVASDTSQFIVEGAISGDLAINNSVIENGFDTTYTVADMIQAGDTSGLNLQSQSALFNATLENNTDAVMTMKSFDSVVKNSSVAEFLQANYAEGNNENLFSALKSMETVAQLNNSIDDLFGKDMFSRMTFDDLSMVREVSLDMNNQLFKQEGAFAFGGNVSPSSYDNNIGSVGRYSLNGFNSGKMSFGVGVSITDVRTNDGHNNSRFDRNFMMSAPIGYKTHGFELITAPKMGYADGTYDRKGFNNKTYDGKIQKRMFALMNEARYPVKFGGLKLIPTAEFNMIGYNIKGHEDGQEYALRIKSQNHYSVEAGLGLMAEKEFKPYKNHKFNVSGGVAVYHEFANPYELDVAMSRMSGTYRLRDEKRSDNRAAVRFGFGYALKDYVDVTANLLTNIDREYRTDASIDMKYHF